MSNQQFNETPTPKIPLLNQRVQLKCFFIIIILLVIVIGLWLNFLIEPKKEKVQSTEKIKYLNYRNTNFNVSFQYPSSLHLIENQQKNYTKVCTSTYQKDLGYENYDVCQRHIFEPFISLISNDGKSVIEISIIESIFTINNLETLWEAFLKQYFAEFSFDKKSRLSLDVNKLPLDRTEDVEPIVFIYSSSNNLSPVIVFIPIRRTYAWVLVLKDNKFQEALDTVVKSFNLNNTLKLMEIDLTNGNVTTIESPLYVANFQFNDFYGQKILLSDIEKVLIFDQKERKFNELFKFNELKDILKIDFDLDDWKYRREIVFDRTNPNIIYGLIMNNIIQYNIQTKEANILYKGELPVTPLDLYPPIGRNLIIGSSYADAGCAFTNISVLNLDNKKLKKGWSEMHCVDEEGAEIEQENFAEKAINISSDGIYVFVSSKRNNYSDLYLYNNLTGKKSLIWSGKVPKIDGWLISDYRFKLYDEDEKPKIYNLQIQQFEEWLSDLDKKLLNPYYKALTYNQNGFIYEKEEKLYYLDYQNKRVIPFYGISKGENLFLTDSHVFVKK